MPSFAYSIPFVSAERNYGDIFATLSQSSVVTTLGQQELMGIFLPEPVNTTNPASAATADGTTSTPTPSVEGLAQQLRALMISFDRKQAEEPLLTEFITKFLSNQDFKDALGPKTQFVDTHKSCSYLGLLRPDITMAAANCPLNILSVKCIIEFKKFGLQFGNNEKGQLCVYLNNTLAHDVDRQLIFGVLFNGESFVVIRATCRRGASGEQSIVTFAVSPDLSLTEHAQLFVAILLASDTKLGRANSPVPLKFQGRFVPSRFLGIGASSIVYEAFDTATKSNVAVKWCHDLHSFANERLNLGKLAEQSKQRAGHGLELPVFPQLVAEDEHGKFMVTTPVCVPRKDFNVPITRGCIRKLVHFVDLCSTSVEREPGFVCYDIRPENIMFTQQGELCIIDLADGYAFNDTEKVAVAGTARYACEEVLRAYQKQIRNRMNPAAGRSGETVHIKVTHAFQSIVRFVYTALFPSMAQELEVKIGGKTPSEPEFYDRVIEFWREQFDKSPKVWLPIEQAANKEDSHELIQRLEAVFDVLPFKYRQAPVRVK